MPPNAAKPADLAWHLAWTSLLLVLILVLVTAVRLVWNLVPTTAAAYALIAVCGVWWVIDLFEIRRRLRLDYGVKQPGFSAMAGAAARGLPRPWRLLAAFVGAFCLVVCLGFAFGTERIVRDGARYVVKHHPEQVRTEGQAESAENDQRIAIFNLLAFALLWHGAALASIHFRTYDRGIDGL